MLPHIGHEFVDCMRHHLECQEAQNQQPRWLRRCQTFYVIAACASAITFIVLILF